MALVNTHPDYLKSKLAWDVYYEFLNKMKERDCYWHALPGEVAGWWKRRMISASDVDLPSLTYSKVLFDGNNLKIKL